jgi:hypothetical protein
MEDQNWINLNEAAELAGCSRKTLYRYMAKNQLAYRKAENNRRYVQRHDIETLFPEYRQPHNESPSFLADLTKLVSLLERISAEVESQSILLERMVALYQPKSLAELMAKREKRNSD